MSTSPFPDAKSPDLCLAHPSVQERQNTWRATFTEWGVALPDVETYLQRELHLMDAPLARDGGLTHWILVDKNEPVNSRQILASCESLRKPALISTNGQIKHVLTHGIGSVFCEQRYRGRGYASRMMTEVGEKLRTWQTDPQKAGHEEVGFSILYSDIGKAFYASHGWHPFPSTHISFPVDIANSSQQRTSLESGDTGKLLSEYLPPLCAKDVQMIEDQLQNARDGKVHVALVPDIDAIEWHRFRESFVCGRLFSENIPHVRGAIAGVVGQRVWAIWTRNYYSPPDSQNGKNTLHILRLVIEDETNLQRNALHLGKVLEVAMMEAAKWKLPKIELWNPSPLVCGLVEKAGLEHSVVQREKDSIASLMWYGEGEGGVDQIEWIGNEKYGWC